MNRRTENRVFKERESTRNLLKISTFATGENIKGVCLGKERGLKKTHSHMHRTTKERTCSFRSIKIPACSSPFDLDLTHWY